MLTVLAILALVAGASVVAVVLAALVERRDRRRLATLGAQLRATDAIHREFGAIAAPVVRRGRSGELTVGVRLAAGDLPVAGRLLALVYETLRDDGRPVVVVLAPRPAPDPRRRSVGVERPRAA